MSRKAAGAKNQPPSHKKPTSGPMASHFNRGDAGKKRKPAQKRSGKSEDIDTSSTEFDDIAHP